MKFFNIFQEVGTVVANITFTMKKSYYLLAAVFAATATTAFATGFALNEVSSRGNARQFTLVGSTRDASAVFFNPANMTELEDGFHSMFGVTLIRPDYKTTVTTPAGSKTTDQDEKIFVIPHFFVSGKIAEDLYLGFGEYSEFGLGTKYEGGKNWGPLAANSYKTTIETFTISPTIAWKATDDFSIGGGLRVMNFDVCTTRNLGAPYGTLDIAANDLAVSYLLSASYQISDTLRAGIVYRAEGDIKADGDVHVGGMHMGGVDGELTLPSSIMLGLNWQASEKLDLGFNATWTGWSSMDKISIDFANPMLKAMAAQAGLNGIDLNWQDSWRFSIGGEYALNDNWSLIGGYSHDIDCTDAGYANTLVPPGDRDQLGLGFAYGKDSWKVAFNYMVIFMHETERKIHGLPVEFTDTVTQSVALSFSKSF